MIIAQMTGPQFSAAFSLQEGINYRCGANLCYAIAGSQEAQQRLEALQQAANIAAKALGIPTQIDVDGLIGTQTISLIRTIANRINAQTGVLAQARGTFNKELAVKNLDALVQAFRALATPTPMPTPQPTAPTPTAPTPTTTAPVQPGTSPMQPAAEEIETRSKLTSLPAATQKVPIGPIAAVIGGFLLLGTIIAVAVVKKSESR